MSSSAYDILFVLVQVNVTNNSSYIDKQLSISLDNLLSQVEKTLSGSDSNASNFSRHSIADKSKIALAPEHFAFCCCNQLHALV